MYRTTLINEVEPIHQPLAFDDVPATAKSRTAHALIASHVPELSRLQVCAVYRRHSLLLLLPPLLQQHEGSALRRTLAALAEACQRLTAGRNTGTPGAEEEVRKLTLMTRCRELAFLK